MSNQQTPIVEAKPIEVLKAAVPELKAIMMLNANEGTDVETLVLQELEYVRMAALSKPEILECLPQTILMAVKSVLKKNLSLDPSAGLVYIKTRWVTMVDPATGKNAARHHPQNWHSPALRVAWPTTAQA